MSTEVITALVSGLLTLIGTILTVTLTARKTDQKRQVELAVINEKITELTREVRDHNNFARRMPVAESKIDALEKRVDKIERK